MSGSEAPAGLFAAAKSVLLGVGARISRDALTDHAAALTYYAFLSIFPALIVLVALLGLLGSYPETYNSIVSTLHDAAPGAAVDTIDGALKDALQSRSTAGGLLGAGLLIAAYSATSATGAALRAVRAVYDRTWLRPWWKEIAARIGLTLVIVALLAIGFTAILVAGPLFSSIADEAGIDESVSGAIGLIRWPLGVAAMVACALVIYRAGAGPEEPLRRILPGAVAASLLWVAASLGFDLYVANFSSYDATYGSLGAVIVLLIWLWIGNLALLAGAALNVELRDGPLPPQPTGPEGS